jgi:hypothetical protein
MSDYDMLLEELGERDGLEDRVTKGLRMVADILKSHQADIKKFKRQMRKFGLDRERAPDEPAQVQRRRGNTISGPDGAVMSVDSFFAKALNLQAAGQPINAPMPNSPRTRAGLSIPCSGARS